MKLSHYVGVMLSIVAVVIFGCCPEPNPVEPYEPQSLTIEIVENQDAPKIPSLENPAELVSACKPEPDKISIWHGDTVSFVSKYDYDAMVTMAPGPFTDEIATFRVKAGETKKLTVGEAVKDGYWWGFQLSCDASGPGPGMTGDDPTGP